MKPRLTTFLKAMILTVVLVVLAVPLKAHSAVTITAGFVTVTGDALIPTNTAWNSATQYTVPLDSVIGPTGIPQLLPPSQWRYLKVKAIHDGMDIFFRYEWSDSTASALVEDAPLFADAVAMEIPFVTPSSIAMGNQREPVNILFWRADLPNPQNIVAGGAGTVQESPDSGGLPPDTPPLITHYQNYANGAWTVIFKRPLSGAISTRGNLVNLSRSASYRIAFAQWNGANAERNGLKMVTGSWQTLFIQ